MPAPRPARRRRRSPRSGCRARFAARGCRHRWSGGGVAEHVLHGVERGARVEGRGGRGVPQQVRELVAVEPGPLAEPSQVVVRLGPGPPLPGTGDEEWLVVRRPAHRAARMCPLTRTE